MSVGLIAYLLISPWVFLAFGYGVGWRDHASAQAGPAARLLAACNECEKQNKWRCEAKRSLLEGNDARL